MDTILVRIPEWLRTANGSAIECRDLQDDPPASCVGELRVTPHDKEFGTVEVFRIFGVKQTDLGTLGNLDWMPLDQSMVDGIEKREDGSLSLAVRLRPARA